MLRESCRGIIIKDGKLLSMYREKQDRIFYTFPGGGRDDGESLEECVTRECKEEFGIDIEPIKEIYTYQTSRSYEHFFICTWTGGEFGSGQGEEFQPGSNGYYEPRLIALDDIPTLPLMPPEVAEALVNNLKVTDDLSTLDVKLIITEFH